MPRTRNVISSPSRHTSNTSEHPLDQRDCSQSHIKLADISGGNAKHDQADSTKRKILELS